MSIFRRGSIYWYEFEFRGQRIRESTGSTSKTLAVQAERKRRRELEESANGVVVKRRPMLFSVAAREWTESSRARWSTSNIAIQQFNLKHLLPSFGAMLLADIMPQHIGKYQGQRKKQGASNRTINMEVSTLRMILKSCKLWSVVQDDVRMLPERHQVGKALEADQIQKLLRACRLSPQPSLLTAVVIFANTALRNGELRKARWRQVDFLRAQFQVGAAKTEGSQGRVVDLEKAALEAFTTWKARWPEAGPDDFIFPSEKLVFKGSGSAGRHTMTAYATDTTKPLGSWKTAWKSAQAQAGVKARIHDLRHHSLTVLAELGTPIATIQSISGHLSPKMVRHYTHIRDQARRKAMEALDTANRQAVQ